MCCMFHDDDWPAWTVPQVAICAFALPNRDQLMLSGHHLDDDVLSYSVLVTACPGNCVARRLYCWHRDATLWESLTRGRRAAAATESVGILVIAQGMQT